ncbi:translation initiation factor IF-2-like [Felis catus]|uniref:translation initiation factor IF-2-like n=1 Tax=Felis catus TaxID=9685 RepID=UPI001D1A2745|nr:translation initiation factor IF-2-like [Felis catus]XP_044890876.1 translation initiation factor IF-2-like [Felis catus]XP_044890877.1 translation initiation factor IF-2-like [Felis catus]XP_044890878.1 translation initiation factor IF-2-like [Felis catus]XP_044890879.1 translation initiation factor IF-2-like [Felis catus]XP_044890880.1 translation initiation factor IF-2-like [Felis catus]
MCRASGGQAARSRAGPLPAWKGGRGRGWGGRAGRLRRLPRGGGLLGGVWGGDGVRSPRPLPTPPLGPACKKSGGHPATRRPARRPEGGLCGAQGFQGASLRPARGQGTGDRGQGSRAAGTRGARRPETRPRLLSFQRLDFLERTPFGFAIFTRPSLPVSMATPPNSRFQAAMTSPFPFLPPRPPGAAGPTPSRAPLRPGRAPTPLPSPGRGVPRAPAPLPARRRGLGGPRRPSPRGGCAGAPVAEGTGPGRPSLPLRDPCHAGRPVGAARALAAGEAGAGRRQASLAAGVAARLAWEAPAAPSSETGDLRQRGSEVAGEPQGPVAWSFEPLPLCPWASEPPPAWWQSCPGLSWAMRCTPGS